MVSTKKKKKRPIKKWYKRFRQANKERLNFLFSLVKPSGVVNQKEIRFIGLQRSGNHPLINWLFTQAKEVRCFLNWAPVDQNPFIYFQKRGTVDEFQTDFFEKFNILAEQLGFFSKKNFLMYSYEDEFLKDVATDRFERNHDRWLGKSADRFDVLLLRDPFNLFASRLKKEDDVIENRYSLRVESERKTLIRLWKEYAKEFLGDTNFLPNKVTISYNHWFLDENYRKSLADKLGLDFSDETMNKVLPVGGGSSFDRTSKDASGTSMKVLDRWKHYQNEEIYKSIFKSDPEIIELSNRIFGEFEGVDEWINS